MKTTEIQWVLSTDSYKALKKQIDSDADFALALQVSLMIAHRKALATLKEDLYFALDNVFGGNGKGWPTTPEDYLDYIAKYMVLIPNEEDDPDYPAAWTSNDQVNGYNQKVYDLLCQFYFLVDQPIPDTGITLQDYIHGAFDFGDWLRQFAIDWGTFLDTPESYPLSAKASFFADPMYNMPWYQENASGWKSFNNFFYREFNGADAKGQSPLRPIAEPKNNNAIVSSADCTYKQAYSIDEHGNVLGINGTPSSINLKNTHNVATVAELLQDKELAAHFNGGTFVRYFLSPFDYHRFHSPSAGKVKACKVVEGKVFLDVNMTEEGEFDAPDSALGGYEFNQRRGVFVVDAGDPIGLVASVPIGMAQVSGVYMRELEGKEVAKGDEFGKFMFGGSDTILLFQKNADLYLWEKDPSHNPIHFQYGQVAAYWNAKEQH